MAAGLGFKDFTTGEVLTAADVDGYLMQGIWVFASAAARDAAVTSPQEGNFAFLKDTNTTTYYTGSAWTNLDTTGMVNPMTTTGDIIYSSPGSTPVRLGIGTAGQVLKVNSGATAPEWAAPTAAGFVGCRLFNNGNQSISNNTFTAINFDSETYDTNTFHSTSSNTSRITIPSGYDGKYLILGIYVLQQNSTGVRLFRFNKNGNVLCNNTTVPATAFEISGSLSTIESLSAGDYVEFMVYQDSGGSLNIKGDAQPQTVFSIAYLGA